MEMKKDWLQMKKDLRNRLKDQLMRNRWLRKIVKKNDRIRKRIRAILNDE